MAVGRISMCLLCGIIYNILLTCNYGLCKSSYKPYGPKMCRVLCDDVRESFLYIPEEFLCYQIRVYDSRDRENNISSCPKVRQTLNNDTVMADITGWDVCKKEYQETSLISSTEMKTKSTCSEPVNLAQHYRDITHNKACKEGRLSVVKYILLHRIADINCRGTNGRTPVMSAARRGQATVFDFLVSQGCMMSDDDDRGDNLLHMACMGGNDDIVRMLVKNENFSLEVRGQKGQTPLMKAAYHGHRRVFEFLVKKGGGVVGVDEDGNTILHLACAGGHLDMVKFILTHSMVGIESRGYKYRTPVMTAMANGYIKLFDYFVSKNSNLTKVDEDNDNLLHIACTEGQVDMIQYILTKGLYDIESKGYHGMTPVLMAAEIGHIGMFDFLMSKGCNVTAVDADNSNILHLSIYRDHMDMVKHIVKRKVVDIDSKWRKGETPVMIAAATGQEDVFDFLVSEGCNVTAVDLYGHNILHLACIGSQVNIVKYILTQGLTDINSKGYGGMTPIMIVAGKGQRYLFDLLVSKGSNLKVVNTYGNNILHLACFEGQVNMVKYILTQGLIDIESKGYGGMTPIMFAAGKGHRYLFDLLVSKGSNLKVLNTYGNNILHVACVDGQIDMIKYILTEKIFDIESKGEAGRTPVLLAAMNGSSEVLNFLVSEGCNVTAVDLHGDNILHLACIEGQVNMVKYILTQGLIDIESRGMKGMTPVLMAAEKGQRAVFAYLVGRNCTLSAVDIKGNNILHLACSRGHIGMVAYISKTISLERFKKKKNTEGNTPVMVARLKGHGAIIRFIT